MSFYSLLPTPYHPTPYSLLPTPYSLLPTPYSLLPITLLPTPYLPIALFVSLFFRFHIMTQSRARLQLDRTYLMLDGRKASQSSFARRWHRYTV